MLPPLLQHLELAVDWKSPVFWKIDLYLDQRIMDETAKNGVRQRLRSKHTPYA
jgi:hypothetical protein